MAYVDGGGGGKLGMLGRNAGNSKTLDLFYALFT